MSDLVLRSILPVMPWTAPPPIQQAAVPALRGLATAPPPDFAALRDLATAPPPGFASMPAARGRPATVTRGPAASVAPRRHAPSGPRMPVPTPATRMLPPAGTTAMPTTTITPATTHAMRASIEELAEHAQCARLQHLRALKDQTEQAVARGQSLIGKVHAATQVVEAELGPARIMQACPARSERRTTPQLPIDAVPWRPTRDVGVQTDAPHAT